MKKTKIVCTMGPGTDGDGILEQIEKRMIKLYTEAKSKG